jgi:hypothetical protein
MLAVAVEVEQQILGAIATGEINPAPIRLENAMRSINNGGRVANLGMTQTLIEMSVMAVMEDVWVTCEEMNLLEGEAVLLKGANGVSLIILSM